MLICPPYMPQRSIRHAAWHDQIENYLSSEALSKLFSLFDFNLTEGTLRERVNDARSFADRRWDYRRRAGSGERWTIRDDDPIVLSHRNDVLACARELGMIGHKCCRRDIDYILVMGGARAANLDRMEEARRLLGITKRQIPVIALTTMRPLNSIEIPYVEDYVVDATADVTTEFDVMCGAMIRVFDTAPTTYAEIADDERVGINQRWAVRTFGKNAVLCAPSSDPTNRRANTLDTLEFFRKTYQPEQQCVLACTTSSIYISYQTASLVPHAIQYGWELVFSGSGDKDAHNEVASNYLQEIKGTIDSIARYLC